MGLVGYMAGRDGGAFRHLSRSAAGRSNAILEPLVPYASTSEAHAIGQSS
jgi:hypothetical protein